MILLAAAFAVMTIAVLATVIAPLVGGTRAPPERAAFDRSVYRDQLKELERDVARGLVQPDEAATARLEIERRLLATDTPEGAPPARAPGSPRLAALLAAVVAVGAAGLYVVLGAPGASDRPFAERGPERSLAAAGGRGDLDKTVTMLREKLKQKPDNAGDWVLLGRTQAALGHWPDSAEAYHRALELTPGQPDIAAAYGEMLVMAADGIVTPAARGAFTAAMARDAHGTVARFYLALAQAQAGNAPEAISGWQELAAEAPEGSPLRAELGNRIAATARSAGLPVPALAQAPAAAPGPDAAAMAAAAQKTPQERQAMIRGMVDQLAARLAAEPGDLEGWLRLGRSYGVLGEPDKAAEAYEHAAALKPDAPEILLDAAQTMLAGHRPDTPVPARALDLLRRVEALDPDQPAALWYLGLAEAQARRFDTAAQYWQRLLAQLPAGSNESKTVTAALAALKGK